MRRCTWVALCRAHRASAAPQALHAPTRRSSQVLSLAVERRLREVLQAEYDEDGALVKYCVAMVAHRQSQDTIAAQLEEFLEGQSAGFAEW